MTSQPFSLCLPDEIRDRFAAVSEIIGKTHRSLGLIVDEYLSEVPYGQHMAAYELFADLYREKTGEQISARTIRIWRHAVIDYSKHDLLQYESLSDAQLTEAVSLAEVAKVTAADVCEWTIANAIDSVPAMRAHWLPQTSTEYEIDLPGISGMKRTIERWIPQDDPDYQTAQEHISALARLLSARMKARTQ